MKLKEYLKTHRISYQRMANALGIHANHIYLLANEKRNASLKLARHIERITAGVVTVNDLILTQKMRCPCCNQFVNIRKYTCDNGA